MNKFIDIHNFYGRIIIIFPKQYQYTNWGMETDELSSLRD
jgi:hypothetical protein